MNDRDGIAFQHRRLRTFLDEFSDALARQDRRQCETAVFRLQGAVHAHFDVEEQVVFPSVRGANPELSQELDALERDHRRLRYLLETLGVTVISSDAATVSGVLRDFREALDAHEQSEEELLGRIPGHTHAPTAPKPSRRPIR